MEAIMYELNFLRQLGLEPTRILLAPCMLEVLKRSHELVTGFPLPIGFREGTFSGLPFMTVDTLTVNFEIAVNPTR